MQTQGTDHPLQPFSSRPDRIFARSVAAQAQALMVGILFKLLITDAMDPLSFSLSGATFFPIKRILLHLITAKKRFYSKNKTLRKVIKYAALIFAILISFKAKNTSFKYRLIVNLTLFSVNFGGGIYQVLKNKSEASQQDNSITTGR